MRTNHRKPLGAIQFGNARPINTEMRIPLLLGCCEPAYTLFLHLTDKPNEGMLPARHTNAISRDAKEMHVRRLVGFDCTSDMTVNMHQ